MIKDNLDLLYRMNKLQYYSFLRSALGMKYYLFTDGQELRTHTDDDDDIKSRQAERRSEIREKERILANVYKGSKRVKTFVIKDKDYEDKTFHDELDNVYNAKQFFDEINPYIVWAIMMGVLGLESFIKEKHFSGDEIGREIFERNRPDNYRFILGAGVNKAFSLGDWDELVSDIRDQINILKGISNTNGLTEFEKSMSNTNYIAPQILKDLDACAYYDTIYSRLYSTFSADKMFCERNPDLVDTTLYQVARIISTKKDVRVLTFNYDDLLEQVLLNNFATMFSSVYYKSKKRNEGIEIIHSHGFYPYGKSGEGHARSIVFSCFEYMNGYLKTGSYARKKLNEQIMHPCILLGNSLSDYEEQKVFYLHHKRFLTHFNYLFTKRSDMANQWMDEYKNVYFMNMGVIPVYFNDYDEMTNYLKGF